jgi:hypothetical protein
MMHNRKDRLRECVSDSGAVHAYIPEEQHQLATEMHIDTDVTLCGLLDVIEPDWLDTPPKRTADKMFNRDGKPKRYYNGNYRVMCGRCADNAPKVRDAANRINMRIKTVGAGQVGLRLAPVISLSKRRRSA